MPIICRKSVYRLLSSEEVVKARLSRALSGTHDGSHQALRSSIHMQRIEISPPKGLLWNISKTKKISVYSPSE